MKFKDQEWYVKAMFIMSLPIQLILLPLTIAAFFSDRYMYFVLFSYLGLVLGVVLWLVFVFIIVNLGLTWVISL